MESLVRVGAIPIVEAGLECSEKMYTKLKETNTLTRWYFHVAEISVKGTLNLTKPALVMFSGPISVIDSILCKSLDVIEQKLPSIYLPPEMMYSYTQEYMRSKVVKPVLSRADSVLESRVSQYAAGRLDHALNAADIYVDKYLPPDQDQDQDLVDGPNMDEISEECNGKDKAVHAIQHVDRLTRKLQRRLTRRTVLEARALKAHTTEAIHVLVYVAELIVTDPKLALVKAKELWSALSEDEPENQARPTNIEQLIVLVTRECARRWVHLINFTLIGIIKLPSGVVQNLKSIAHHLLIVANSLVEKAHLDKLKEYLLIEAIVLIQRMGNLLSDMQYYSKSILQTTSWGIFRGLQDLGLMKINALSTGAWNGNGIPVAKALLELIAFLGLEEVALLIAGNYEREKLRMPNNRHARYHTHSIEHNSNGATGF